MKDDCIQKICNLPSDLHKAKNSIKSLLIESQFQHFSKEINELDIISYLQNHLFLVDEWKQYSEDKRTDGGFYYFTNYVGSLDHKTFDKTFTSDIEACAVYILQEISFWQNLKE